MFFGCKPKNQDLIKPNQANLTQSQIINEAQAWFNTHEANKSINRNNRESQSIEELLKTVDWTKARQYKHIGKDVVEVDLDMASANNRVGFAVGKGESNNVASFSGMKRLVMYKQRDGVSFNTYIMVAVAKEKYKQLHPDRLKSNQQNRWDADFSGWILFYDWNENFVNGYELEDGKVVLVSKQYPTSQNKEILNTEDENPGGGTPTSGSVCTDVWVQTGWDCERDPMDIPSNDDDPELIPCDHIVYTGYWTRQCWDVPLDLGNNSGNTGGTGGGSGTGGNTGGNTNPTPPATPIYPVPDMDCQGCYETFMDNPQEVCGIICDSDYGMANVSPALTAITKNYGNLTPVQTQVLDQSLHTLIDNSPIFKVMYNYLVQKSVKITWKFGAPAGAGGGYNPVTKGISLNSFIPEYLSEELFHAFQDAYYGNNLMTNIFNHPQSVGRSNIEFEAQLFLDIMFRTQFFYNMNLGTPPEKDAYAIFGSTDTYAYKQVWSIHMEEYEKYVKYLTKITHTVYSYILTTPRTMSDLGGDEKYFDMLEDYRYAQKSGTQGYGAPSIAGFKPNAMLYLFNLSGSYNYRQTSK